MKTHIIQNGIVVNTIIASVEDAQQLHSGVCIDAIEGGPGWLWDGETLTAPPPPPPVIPDTVSMRQARLALLGAGMLPQVDAALSAMSGVEGEAARIEWEYATEVRRDSQLVAGMAQALSLDDEALDGLLLSASGL